MFEALCAFFHHAARAADPDAVRDLVAYVEAGHGDRVVADLDAWVREGRTRVILRAFVNYDGSDPEAFLVELWALCLATDAA